MRFCVEPAAPANLRKAPVAEPQRGDSDIMKMAIALPAIFACTAAHFQVMAGDPATPSTAKTLAAEQANRKELDRAFRLIVDDWRGLTLFRPEDLEITSSSTSRCHLAAHPRYGRSAKVTMNADGTDVRVSLGQWQSPNSVANFTLFGR